MMQIDGQSGRFLTLPPDLKVGDPVELAGDFSKLQLTTTFSTGTLQVPVSIGPSFRFLGRGREKLVLSCSMAGSVEDLDDERKSIRAALGVSHVGDSLFSTQIPGKLRGGLASFIHAKAQGLPTYDWYLQSADNSMSLTPDLSLEGEVFASTTRHLSAHSKRAIQIHYDAIEDQLLEIAAGAAHSPSPSVVALDTYFCLFAGEGVPKVILGDFDRESFIPQSRSTDAFDLNREKIADFMGLLSYVSAR